MPLSRRAGYQRPQPPRRLARWGVAVTVVISALFGLPVSARMQSLPVVLVGAGDIAACDSSGDEATAALLDAIDGTVFTLGDNVYNSGTRREFAECYDPTWGRHKGRTRPAPGNHDYGTAKASGYFGYFGEAAGDPRAGYYSYDLGAWHIIVINSNCEPTSPRIPSTVPSPTGIIPASVRARTAGRTRCARSGRRSMSRGPMSYSP